MDRNPEGRASNQARNELGSNRVAATLIVVCALWTLSAPAQEAGAAFRPRAARGLAAFVDPRIGTGGTGHTFPGAAWPFGMVQLSPDTRLEGWEGCSGYWYPETYVHGFSHTHLSGTGVGDYCDILLMPRIGPPRFTETRSPFVHEEEWASTGYYAVKLQDTGILVELTATARTGMHRYRFPQDGPGHVLLDLVHRDEVLDSAIEIRSDREVSGFRRSRGWATDQHVYFVARFSRPIRATTFEVAGVQETAAPPLRRTGTALFAALEFDSGPPLLVKVGISAVSEDGARRNLDAEQPGWNFDAVRDRAERTWEHELDRIRIEGGTPSQRRTFYTALYHLFLQPNLYNDVDGQYRGRDLQVHTAQDGNHYTVFSLWDTFRAAHPLYTLLDEERTRDFARTFLRQYDEGGALPVWELAANETHCMIGYHSVPVLAEAILKGIPGIDAPRAFEAMLASARADRRGLPDYRRRGFIPAEEEGESVSQTLEYAYDDACIAKVAAHLGRREEQVEFERRAQSYAHLFDPTTGFMRARLHGHWFTPFEPAEVNFHYTEANAWQYSFFVPHDVDGLMRLHGGREAFAAKLDAMFAADSRLRGTQQADITGLIGQYAHGNEPSHHMAYLYVHAGQPWKTQSLVRRICNDLYADRPDGLPGNEDCGQMSAWYVWSALGLYPVDPASGHYVLGSPLFEQATVQLGNGKRFVVRAKGKVASHAYVQSARLHGRPLERTWVTWDEITRGGELEFTMGPEPALDWGSAASLAPGGDTHDETPAVVPAPYVARGERLFVGATEVTLACADPTARIAYAMDGAEPDISTAASACNFALDRTTHVRAVAVRGAARSPVVDLHFFARDPNRHVQLNSRYTPRYGAGGDDALVDGLRGRANFRLGAWQGFQGQDLDATIDLGRALELRGLALGCLQDTRSWIVYPTAVEFTVSEDGTHFESAGVATHDVPDRDLEVQTHDFDIAFAPRRARYIRIRARSYGLLPEWHPGKGGASFIFTDELAIHESER